MIKIKLLIIYKKYLILTHTQKYKFTIDTFLSCRNGWCSLRKADTKSPLTDGEGDMVEYFQYDLFIL